MSFFESVKSPKLKNPKRVDGQTPEGLWKKCHRCGEILQTARLEKDWQVCPSCGHHFRLPVLSRLALIIDEGSFQEMGRGLRSCDPLEFVDKRPYKERLAQAQKKTGLQESVLCGKGRIDGHRVCVAVMNFQFMGGSMGAVAGEKVAMALERACQERIPCVIVSCSGGARMQEGILSLVQMAKTSGLISQMRKQSVPLISVLTDPTTGGVAASFAMLGDVNLAEPGALIGFAGPRVIEQSIRQVLPEGFQRAEFLQEHGFIDRIVHRKDLKKELSFFVKMFSRNGLA